MKNCPVTLATGQNAYESFYKHFLCSCKIGQEHRVAEKVQRGTDRVKHIVDRRCENADYFCGDRYCKNSGDDDRRELSGALYSFIVKFQRQTVDAQNEIDADEKGDEHPPH